jgi:hypothetical protein
MTRSIWRQVAVCALVFFIAVPALAQTVLKRKNIDDLSPQELSAYEHAFQILKDRSAKNQYDKTGFLWHAWVHNCPSTYVPKDGKPDGRKPVCDFWEGGPPDDLSKYELAHPGMCEHGKDLFLPWHRAEFYFFEKVLQGADPDGTIKDSRGQTGPSTKYVTVPYWNWTRAPSGVRYAAAFENPSSALYNDQRSRDPIAPGSAYPFASAYLIGYMVHFLEWPAFGGNPMAKKGGYGTFEAVAHNPMHSLYIAGPMESPPTAALDPIFYSFHAYIDLIYEEWLRAHGSAGVTSQDFFLRGEQPEQIPRPAGYVQGAGKPSMGQVKLYFDTKALGYEYEVTAKDALPSRDELIKVLGLQDQQDPPVFGVASSSLITRLIARGGFQASLAPSFVRTLDLKIPAVTAIANDQQFGAKLDRNMHEPDLSYQMDVYVYPKEAPFDPGSQPFRKRYLAATGVHWGSGAMHHHDEADAMVLDISKPVLDLIKSGRSGQTWNMSLAITLVPALTTFGDPSLVSDPALR